MLRESRVPGVAGLGRPWAAWRGTLSARGPLRAQLLSPGSTKGIGETRGKETSRGAALGLLGGFSPPKWNPRCTGLGRAGTHRPALPGARPAGALGPSGTPPASQAHCVFPNLLLWQNLTLRGASSKITINQRGARMGFAQTPVCFSTPVLQPQSILSPSIVCVPCLQHGGPTRRMRGRGHPPLLLLQARQEPQPSAVPQRPAASHPQLRLCQPDLRLCQPDLHLCQPDRRTWF